MARAKAHNISEEKYLEAINWLENSGTKKGACEILGVGSNPTMERLIEEYYETKKRDKEHRARKRKLPVSKDELVLFIMDYINGFSLQDLSERHYRSADTIKTHLIKNGAFLRQQAKIDPLDPPMLPDACVATSFEKGQYVWAAKYGCIAQVKGTFKNAYRIQVLGNGMQESSYQAAAELGNLKHLEDLGVKLEAFEDYMSGDEVNAALAATIRAANKAAK